jgi:site-specific DNA recombinase
MRTIIYARYSSDRQRETSIADQVRVCRSRASAEQWSVVGFHSDEEVSGSTPVAARPGGAEVLLDAAERRFDLLLLEGLDRLSRDLVEQETVVRRLEHRGIRIVCVSDGYDSQSASRKIHRGMRGLINEIYLDDLRAKTHRGLSGQVARGYNAGGLGYGYRSVPDGRGHRLEIDEERAPWVVWIFQQFISGWSPRRIAAELNNRKIPSPRGSSWAGSALYGSPAKGTGILNNVLYTGRYTWNRSQWVTNPDTGRRQRVERPEAEWQVEVRPELKVLSDELWQAARARLERSKQNGGCKGRGPGPKTLFSGMLECGVCGGAMVAVSGVHYGCLARKERGAVVCRGILAARKIVDRSLLAEVQNSILAPGALRELQLSVEAILGGRNEEFQQGIKMAQKRAAELDREIEQIVEAIVAVGISRALEARLKAAEAEREELRLAMAQRLVPVPTIPNIEKLYRDLVADLGFALSEDRVQAREILQKMLGRIKLVKQDEGEIWAEITTNPQFLSETAGLSPILVAGAGFEPTTFGL